MHQEIVQYFEKFYNLMIKSKSVDSNSQSQWQYFTSMFKNPTLEKERIQLYLNILENERRKKSDDLKYFCSNSNNNQMASLSFNKAYQKEQKKLYNDHELKENRGMLSYDNLENLLPPKEIHIPKFNNKTVYKFTPKEQSVSANKTFNMTPPYPDPRIQKKSPQIHQFYDLDKRHSLRSNQNLLPKFIESTNKLLQSFEETQGILLKRF